MELPVIIKQITNWIEIHAAAAWWLGGLSAATFVITLMAIPLLVARIPADYFAHDKREKTLWANQHPFIRTLLLASKNVIGGAFVISGIVMLILPGQGLLTILIGSMLIDFPGKYQLERWLVAKPPVLKTVNWLRTRSGHPPIKIS